MYTEEEAKKKWCPFVLPEETSGEPFNGKPTCVGSKCMMWRWKFIPRIDDAPVLHEATGYCGLAGKI